MFAVLINERYIGLGFGRSWKLVRGNSWLALWVTVVPVLLAILLPACDLVSFGSSTWRDIDIVAHRVLLTNATLVAVLLYRWLSNARTTVPRSRRFGEVRR